MNHQNHTQAHALNRPRPAGNRKAALRPALLAALAVCLLVLPASAHLGPEGSASSALYTSHSGLDNCRFEGFKETCDGTEGVSGTYINYYQNKYVYDGGTVFGPGVDSYSTTATAWCDQEVQGDGASESLLDEGRVDDEPTSGLVSDGTWDDGGVGGACHTLNAYGVDGYDTPGCGRGGNTAYAKDAVSGFDVWISAGCDWEFTGGGQNFGICLVNEVTGGATVPGMAACVNTFLVGGTSGATFVACGADGVMDAVNYGHGGAGAVFPSYASHGIAVHGCNAGDEAAAVFTHDYIDLYDNIGIIPATAGWIDSR